MLRRIAQDWAGEAAELIEVKPLVGGAISTTLCLTLKDGTKAVLKISPHRVNKAFVREAAQLKLMRDLGLPAPQVYVCHIAHLDNPHSYLLMEFIEGVQLADVKQQVSPAEFDQLQENLAGLVLTLHRQTSGKYHRVACEDAELFESWPKFYRHVYDPIWHDVEKNGNLPVKLRKQIGKVHERLERLISHDDQPRLVHWDIWSSNILARRNGDDKFKISGILDPNCKYAHAEAEIAYMDLFHTITPAFTKAYQQEHKLADSYHRVRKHIYQLYPLINHVHLFGSEYLKPLTATAEKLATIV